MKASFNAAAAKLAESLTPANAERLNKLLDLADEAGRINLGRALQALFPALNRKDPKKAQTALRKYRQVIAEAAADAGIAFAIDSDGQTRSTPQQRSLWLRTGDTTEDLLDKNAVQAEIADGKEGTIASKGIPLNENRPLIRYFVVSAQADRSLKNRLLKRLQPHLGAHREARIELASTIEIKPSGKSRDTASAEMNVCDFGLLLVTPSLLSSRFIAQERLAEMGANKRVIPVALSALSEDGTADLEELDPREFFRGKDGKAFSQQKPGEDQDAFTRDLFHEIDRRLKLPKAQRLQEIALQAAQEQPDLNWVSNRGTPLGDLEKHAITSREGIPQIRDNPDYREDALDFLLRWLADEKASPWCALLGEYGMGKTTTCKALARELVERRKKGEKLPLPIYLDLRAIGPAARTALTLEEILTIILSQSWKSGPDSARQTATSIIEQVLKEGALIIWDGLDEVLVHLDTAAGQQFTRQLYRVLPPRAKDAPPNPSRLLISCRTHYFRTMREQQTHFMGEGRENIRAAQYSGFLLLPFDENQIRQYIAQTLPDQNADRVIETIGAIHNLRELAERPYTLSLIAKEFAGIERWKAEGRRVTGVTLYRHMVLSWLERDSGKHHFTADHKQALMEHVAAELWRSGARYWSIADLENWLVEFMRTRPDLAAHYPDKTPDLLKEDLRTATFLVRDDSAGNDQFRFAHTSLQEYFLAGYLRRALIESNPPAWDLPRPSPETIDFLGQWLLEEESASSRKPAATAIQTLSHLRDVYRPNASELAFAYFLLAKQKGYPAPSPAGFQLPGANLAEWEIQGATGAPLLLARANFRGARLWNTQWEHCNLEGADFSGANVERAEFLNSYLARSGWREAALEAVLFRDCRFQDAGFDGARFNRTRFVRCDLANVIGLPAGRPSVVVTKPGGPHEMAPQDASLRLSSGHSRWINGCAWSPDGARVLSASYDNTLRIWDAATGDSLLALQGHSRPVWGCAWSPDGARVLSASDDNTLRIWDAATGDSLLALQGHSGPVRGCAWSPDGARVLSASYDNTLRIWDAATGDSLLALQGHSRPVRGCAWSPDGARVLSASADKTLRIWDAATGDSLLALQGHADYVTACAWSPDGARVLSASADKTLRIWDAATGDSLLALQGHAASVTACAWSPDGARVLSASYDKPLRIWDAATGDSLLALQGHADSVTACAWSPDGARVLSASDDNTLRIWDAATGDSLLALQGHAASVTACAWSPDGARVLSASGDKTLRIWDAATGDSLLALQGHAASVTACAWSPDGARVLSASYDNTLRIWDAATGDSLLALQGHAASVTACAWSPDGARVLSASDDNTLRIWDTATGDSLLALQGHADYVMACAWSPDGARVLSASADQALRIWDAATGDSLLALQGHADYVMACAWSPDGARVLSASDDNTLRIWDAATGDSLLALQGHFDSVTACAWSPDGARVLSASYDKTLRIWDAATGDSLLALQGHAASVTACAWSPDGARVLSASDDNTLRIWDAATGRLLSPTLCLLPHPRSEWLMGTDWASLDFANNRILHCTPGAWRSLGWLTPGDREHPPEWLPAEMFGPLPVSLPPALS